jgi:hypothetical protein
MNITTRVDVRDVARSPDPLMSSQEDGKLTLVHALVDSTVGRVALGVSVLLVTHYMLVVVVDFGVVESPSWVSLFDP